MNAHFYRARYFGGPCDGMVVVATRQGGDHLWSVPVATTGGPADSSGRSTTDSWQAVYRLSRTCHLMDRDTPTVRYEYEFVGLEVVTPVPQRSLGGWLALMKNRLATLFNRVSGFRCQRDARNDLGRQAAY